MLRLFLRALPVPALPPDESNQVRGVRGVSHRASQRQPACDDGTCQYGVAAANVANGCPGCGGERRQFAMLHRAPNVGVRAKKIADGHVPATQPSKATLTERGDENLRERRACICP